MSCYHPLVRYETYETYKTKDGKTAYKAKVIKPDPIYVAEYENAEDFAKKLHAQGHYRRVQVIPCGKCIGCRLENSRDWATKGCYEAMLHKDNWFLTVTYDDKHLPKADPYIDPETGEEGKPNPGGTLVPEHMTLFLKRLKMHYERKYNHKGGRYMLCGEYGSTTARAHYHIILFNIPIKPENLKFWKYNENHEPLWRALELEEIWGKGMVVAADVNWNTCAYVGRYCMKKSHMITKDDYKQMGIAPEFIRASNRPGIGKEYFEKHKNEIYKNDTVLIEKYGGGIMRIRPPKYFDKLYDIENHEELEKIKERRKKDQERITNLKYNQTTLYKKQQLIAEEQTKKGQTTALKRTKI